MIINFFNRDNSKIDFGFEIASLHPNILIADSIMYDGLSSELILAYQDLPTLSEDVLIKMFEDLGHSEEGTAEMTKLLRETQPKVKKLQQLKHKDKTALVYIGNYKATINNLRKNITETLNEAMVFQCLTEMLPFIGQKILNLKYSNFYTQKSLEDPFIRGIADTLIERKAHLCLTELVEELFSFCDFDAANNEGFDFIKIPLWNLPPILGLNYAQVKYTRDYLQTLFAPFKIMLKELKDELYPLPFSIENQHQIKQICSEKLSHLDQDIEKTINEHIYISSLKNRFAENFGTRLVVGITSVENIINFYERADIIPNYVASEIKEQVNRFVDLKATSLFTYYMLHGTNYVEKTSE